MQRSGRETGTARWLVDRRLVLATGVVAALPIIVSTIKVLADGWVPLADDALIAVRSYDVLSANSPLLGPWSSGYSAIVGEPTFHPGPLLFWLLAVPSRLPWPGALEMTVGLVNVASVMGVVGIAHRRGGRALMFATAVAVLLMLASLPAEAYSDIWNPSAPILPFTLLIFLAWSLACGEYRLLPLTVLAASFVAQCHLSYVVPALGVLAVGLGGLILSRRSDRTGSARRWVIAALVVGILCWSGPAIDQATNRPGNLVLIVRATTAHKATLGLHPGWHALAHAIGVVPWWLRDPQGGLERVVDLNAGTSGLAAASTLLIMAALVTLTFAGWRRQRGDVVAAGALALVTCAALVLVTASTPSNSEATLTYSLRWSAPAGMWVWLAVGWSLLELLPVERVLGASRPTLSRLGHRWAPLAALGMVAAVAGVVTASGELQGQPYDQMSTIASRLNAELPSNRPVRLISTGKPDSIFMGLGLQSGMVYSLRRDGRTIDAPTVTDYLGRHYGRHGDHEQLVRLDIGTQPPTNARVLVSVPVVQYPDPAVASGREHPLSWNAALSLVPEATGR